MRQLRKLMQINSALNTSMVIPQVLHDAAIRAIDQALVVRKFPGWFDDNSIREGSDTKTYQYDLEDKMEGDLVSPGAQVPESDEPYTSQITLQVQKIGVRFNITNEMIEDSRYDEMARMTNRAIFKMARLVDRACGRGMTQYSGAFPASGLGVVGGGVVNSPNILEVAPTVGASGFTIPDDLINMIGKLEQKNGKMTDIAMSPVFYGGIRAASWFAPSVKPLDLEGSTDVAGGNGLVGTAYGIRWWQSTDLAYSGTHVPASGVVIGWDATQSPFAFLNKRELQVRQLVDDTRDIRGVVFTQRFNAMNIVPSAVVWVTGLLGYKTYYREFKDRAL